MTFKPRPHQAHVLEYQGGYMGVAAVPGSGKTATLSALAARLVDELVDDRQEVLVVTFANSAVDNFAKRIGEYVRERGLVPGMGYRVRTLHGLAHDIIRERPGLVQLSEDFGILDDTESGEIRRQISATWLAGNHDSHLLYVSPGLDKRQLDKAGQSWHDDVDAIGDACVKRAKDRRWTPEKLKRALEKSGDSLPLASMGAAIYEDYQRAIAHRVKVDFNDLVSKALDALQADADLLARLRQKWPFILEDEAQDSSQLQEDLLRLLAGPDGNWVRVGDPNQAVYETFTNANPRFLTNFLDSPGVTSRELPTSGRSTGSIIELANRLVDWTGDSHPLEAARGALRCQHIVPTEPGDFQQNPPDDPDGVRFHAKGLAAECPDAEEEEAPWVAKGLAAWLPSHAGSTVAVLAPRNKRGAAVVQALKERGLPHVERLQSTSSTRATAHALEKVLEALADPTSSVKLADAYKAWRRSDTCTETERVIIDAQVLRIRRCGRVEDYLWPWLERDWLASLAAGDFAVDAETLRDLADFRAHARLWQSAVSLPVDQLILTLAQDLFGEDANQLALAHKLATAVSRMASTAEGEAWRLAEHAHTLKQIAANERKFIGVSGAETGFDPEAHKGKVAVMTVHGAKGLEWDRVYLVSANNYDFPSGAPTDSYISERWYVRDKLNLVEEALAQMESAMNPDMPYMEGEASRRAREQYVGERLRLLYVAITRARRELCVVWNKGRFGNSTEAVAVTELRKFWDAHRAGVGAAAEGNQ